MLKHAEKYRSERASRPSGIREHGEAGRGRRSRGRRLLARLIRRGRSELGRRRHDARARIPPLAALGDPSSVRRRVSRTPLPTLAPGRWTGPVRSNVRLHLVLVSRRDDGAFPEFGEIRDAVKRDWTIEKQSQVKDAATPSSGALHGRGRDPDDHDAFDRLAGTWGRRRDDLAGAHLFAVPPSPRSHSPPRQRGPRSQPGTLDLRQSPRSLRSTLGAPIYFGRPLRRGGVPGRMAHVVGRRDSSSPIRNSSGAS